MVKTEKLYFIGYTKIPEIDDKNPPEMAILMPRWYDNVSSPHRILLFRYERYVAVFDMGSMKSRQILKCAFDTVLRREDYAKDAFKSKIRNLIKGHYFNHYSIVEAASGRTLTPTLHDMLGPIKTENVIRGINMPCNSKSATADSFHFLSAKVALLQEILDKVSELKECVPG